MATPSLRRLVDALRRLRNADPASGLDTSVDARHYAASITGRDELPLVDGPLTTSRPRGAFLAAATLVVGVSAGAIVLAHHSAGTSTTATGFGPRVPNRSLLARPGIATRGPSTDDPHRDRAEALVAKLLAAAPDLPHATTTHTAPTGPVRVAQRTWRYLLDAHDYATAPGTMAAAIAYLTNHRPEGWILSGTSSGGRSGRTTSRGVMFTVAGTDFAQQASIDVVVAPHGAGVAMSTDVSLYWLPTKPADAVITAPTGVSVVVPRPGRRTVRRTFRHTRAVELAHAIDRLTQDVYGPRPCPMDTGERDVLRFTTPSGKVVATQDVTGCAAITLSRGGKTVIRLAGSVDPKLMHLLDLPANYGFPY